MALLLRRALEADPIVNLALYETFLQGSYGHGTAIHPLGKGTDFDTVLDMLQMVPGSGRITVGAVRGYDTRDIVWDCRDMHITPHAAQRRHSAIDGRTRQHGA